ncbi:MAG: hypothetical protein HPY71_03010 [Firmicutes bacterium]|nr:hypothetical protein [Bacillota bacterium]
MLIFRADLCEDKSDNKFIACALESGAQYLITTDGAHLGGLADIIYAQYRKYIQIMSPYQIVRMEASRPEVDLSPVS